MMRNIFRVLLMASSLPLLEAKVELAPTFSDHMVLQAGRPISIHGRADPSAEVQVTFGGDSRVTQATATGQWEVAWPTMESTMTDTGKDLVVKSGADQVVVHDVLVGEVWLCSGQSNMRFTLGRNYVQPDSKTPVLFPAEISSSRHSRIRLLNVSGGTPADRRWGICGPETTVGFSAIGYFFGRTLQPSLNGVPIGLIDLGKGGEPIRGFLSKKLIQSTPALRDSMPALAPNRPDPTGEIYADDLSWLAPFPVRGVLWYQGESEVTRAKDYPAWMGALIGEWRHVLDSPDAVFLLVQLPVYERRRTDPPLKAVGMHWAEFRDVQLQLADTLTGVSLTPALDLGEQLEIHPHRKPELGRRLARLAEEKVYHHAVPAEAPRLVAANRQGQTCLLTFSNAEGGIVTTRDVLANIECGDREGIFHAVDAQISGNNAITVQLPAGFDATVVRYGWRDYFVPDLFNGESLPVLPFSAAIR